MPMFIIQGLLNTGSLVLYGSKDKLKTCERFALLHPRFPMRGARLTALLPFYRMGTLNRGHFLHWNVDDAILKRSDEFYLFRFVWNWETKQTRVTQILIIQIAPCKTTIIQVEKDLYRRIYKREICKDALW